MSDPRVTFIASVASGEAEAILNKLTGTTIRIVVADDTCGTYAGQVLTFHLASLLIRLFDRVELQGDESASCLLPLVSHHGLLKLTSHHTPFLTALRTQLSTVRPLSPAPASSDLFTVVVGSRTDVQGQLFLGATAWAALISTQTPQKVSDISLPVGAIASATLGASEVFKHIFASQLQSAYSIPTYTLSLLDYQQQAGVEPPIPDHIEIDLTLFGSGSVGCACALGLLVTPQLHGQLVIVDNGRFEPKNVYKYSLLNWAAAEGKRLKAVWVQQQIWDHARDRLKAQAFVGTVDEYVTSLPYDYRIPLAVSAVDTREARIQVQEALPQIIINAGVDGTTVEVSVHHFGQGPCLACLQLEADLETWNAKPIADGTGLAPERVYELIQHNEAMCAEDIAQMKARAVMSADLLAGIEDFVGQPILSLWNNVAYSEAVLHQDGVAPVRVTTAFVSAFAGVLLLAELIKATTPELHPYRVNNSYRQELLGIPVMGPYKHERDSRGWCLCHSSYRLMTYQKKYNSDTSAEIDD